VVQCVEAVEVAVETDTALTKPIIISSERRRPQKQTNKPIVLDCPQDQRSQEFKSRKPKPLLLKTNFMLPHPIQQCCHTHSSSCPTQLNNVATPFLQDAQALFQQYCHALPLRCPIQFKNVASPSLQDTPALFQQCCHALFYMAKPIQLYQVLTP
jgi:hypothetical protein